MQTEHPAQERTTAKRQPKTILSPGSIIANRYEIVDKIGSGGMGAVLRVIDRSLENDVLALKLLFPHMSQDRTSLARFRNEVLITRKLSHPNVVRIYDFGSAGQGYFFISMEYVSGMSLGQRIYTEQKSPLTFAESLQILYKMCIALDYAHRLEVVHRDLKPDNILISERGEVKLTDFGLARSLEIEKGLTNTGETVGTPYYMAPEQLRGERPDHRVDIYALGIVAYEMTMRQRPFSHDNYVALAAMHLNHDIPSFAGKESGIPKWFENFVVTCSEKKPKNRFQSMSEVAEELFHHMHESGIAPCLQGEKFCPLLKKFKKGKKRRFFGLF